ncbi:MAG: ATP-binding cassette domain-containing protein [Bacteroidota bacterium]
MNAIETRGLTKRFGDHTALDRLDLAVPAGAVYGFLGPNGAGKTTTLRILVGLARPTAGEARVLGESVSGRRGYLRRIGYLPDVPAFYDWMSAREYLAMVGRIFGLTGRELDARLAEVLELVGLAGVKSRIGGYSRGMKQRLGLAQALINRPALVFLDEPTSALDPIGRKEVLEAVGSLAGRTTVFFSTHILNDVERVCDTVGILKDGRLVAQESMHRLRATYAAQYVYVEFEEKPGIGALIQREAWAERVEPQGNGWRIRPTDLHQAQRELPGFAAANGLALRRFELSEPTLEDIFVRLVNGK